MSKRFVDTDKIDYTMASVYWGKDNKGKDVYRRTFVAFKSDVDELPNEDVVEVVRCRNCKYWQGNNGGYPHEECRWGKGETPNADDYCSYGEMEVEVKPCPLCGSKAEIIETDDGYFMVQCSEGDCRCSYRSVEFSKSEIVEIWNRRTEK